MRRLRAKQSRVKRIRLDAEFFRVFHQNPENDRMQMQMQMAVDVVERQAGGVEPFKLRVDFGPQLFAQAAVEKITKAGADGIVGKFAARVDQAGDFFRRQRGVPHSNVRCKPTPSFGFSFASATASSKPGSFTIRLALVKIPSRCARMTA